MNQQRENEDSYECFIFCKMHFEVGKRDLKNGGKDRIAQSSPASQIKEKLKKFTNGESFQKKH